MRTVWTVLAISLATLAGCAESPEPTSAGDGFDTSEINVQATDSTGVIRGVVIDPTIVPVPDVTISIVGTEKTTQTTENGAFGFDGLEPGTYFLEANKLGWGSIQQGVDVVAGVNEPPIVKMQLVPDASTRPYVLPLTYDVYIQCSETVILVGYAGGCQNDFLVNYGKDELGRTPDFAQSELIWESTQPLGDWMSFQYSADGGDVLLTDYAQDEGPSPLFVSSNRSLMESFNVIEGYPLQLRVFNTGIEGSDIGRDYGDPVDGDNCIERPYLGGCAKGVGATIDQRLTAFTHTFFNWEPSPDYRFSVDGPPQPPS